MTAVLEPIKAASTAGPIAADRRCKAKTRRGPCRNRPIQGAEVCRSHGGAAPQVQAAAAVRIVEAKVRTLFGKRLDNAPVHNPLDVYSELAGEVRGWLGVMRQLVADLTSPGYRSEMSGEQIRAEVQLYERAMDRANTVLSTYARLGIDERLARISEAQAYMVMGAIEAALAVAGVTGSRAIEAKKAAAKKLRVVDGAVVEVGDATP